ncbi:MAG: hypothetical protein VX265_15245, partial [Myxococcota bacterium]|nr:hypothetical protein [Myxococcota bacterium]
RWLALLGEESHPDFEAALGQVSRRGDWRRDLSVAETATVEAQPSALATLARWGWGPEADPACPPDTVADWVAHAEAATDEGAARRAWLRVLRLDPGHPSAVAWLMRTRAHKGESLFALMNLQRARSPDDAVQTATLLQARGLDAQAAALLTGWSE